MPGTLYSVTGNDDQIRFTSSGPVVNALQGTTISFDFEGSGSYGTLVFFDAANNVIGLGAKATAGRQGVKIGANLSITANQTGYNVYHLGTLTTAANGTHSVIAGLVVDQPQVTSNGATVTDAVSFYVIGVPTGITPTNQPLAVWVAGGKNRFDPVLTVASAASATLNAFTITAQTTTISGSTNITTAAGFNLVSIGIPTYSAASAITITNAATFTVLGAPTGAGAGPATITNAYAVWVQAGITRLDGNLSLANQATNIVGKAATAAMVQITDGTTAIFSVDSRNTVSAVNAVTVTPSAPTIASAAGVTYTAMTIAAYTVTLTGTTTVTGLNGVGLDIGAPTITDSSVVTVSQVSTLRVAAPVAAGSVTITNLYSLDVVGRTLFEGNLVFSDAINIILASTTGTKIGTATTQKIGFFNATPVVQQTQGATLTNNITSGGSANTLANYTDLVTYGNDAAAIRNNLYQMGQTLKTIVDGLRSLGLFS